MPCFFFQNPNDISYVFSGYAPLSVRLAQILHRPGWRSITEVLGMLPGTGVEEIQQIPVGLRKRSKIVMMCLVSMYACKSNTIVSTSSCKSLFGLLLHVYRCKLPCTISIDGKDLICVLMMVDDTIMTLLMAVVQQFLFISYSHETIFEWATAWRGSSTTFKHEIVGFSEKWHCCVLLLDKRYLFL